MVLTTDCTSHGISFLSTSSRRPNLSCHLRSFGFWSWEQERVYWLHCLVPCACPTLQQISQRTRALWRRTSASTLAQSSVLPWDHRQPLSRWTGWMLQPHGSAQPQRATCTRYPKRVMWISCWPSTAFTTRPSSNRLSTHSLPHVRAGRLRGLLLSSEAPMW
jgi:hypothetical protein